MQQRTTICKTDTKLTCTIYDVHEGCTFCIHLNYKKLTQNCFSNECLEYYNNKQQPRILRLYIVKRLLFGIKCIIIVAVINSFSKCFYLLNKPYQISPDLISGDTPDYRRNRCAKEMVEDWYPQTIIFILWFFLWTSCLTSEHSRSNSQIFFFFLDVQCT